MDHIIVKAKNYLKMIQKEEWVRKLNMIDQCPFNILKFFCYITSSKTEKGKYTSVDIDISKSSSTLHYM